MVEPRAPKKAAPRTKGTPRKPPAPRKAVAPAKPKAAPTKAKGPDGRASSPAARPPPAEPRWVPAQPGWAPAARGTRAVPGAPTVSPAPTAGAEPEWIPAPPPATGRPGAAAAFDARTGDWIAVGPATEPTDPTDPAAYRRGTRSIVMHVILGITLAFLALNFVGQVIVGVVLVAAPDSAVADDLRELMEGGASSPGDIIANALLTFLLVGLIPFLWVLGTRVVPWRGAVAYLRLRVGWRDLMRGVVLVPAMIVAVYALVVVYTCAVDGCGALDDPPAEDSPLQQMLDNLTWPVVVTVALAAGIGEEILFRGVLQRWIGIWGQGVAFGLAHAVNAYPPQVLFAFGLGVVFGYLYKRGWSLVSLMVAHFLYDFVLLALALLYPELG